MPMYMAMFEAIQESLPVCPSTTESALVTKMSDYSWRVGGTSGISDSENGVGAVYLRKLTSSKYKGVVPQPNGRWGAQIYEKHRRIWLGTFNEEGEAAKAYDGIQDDIETTFLNSHSKAEIVDMLRKHTYNDELEQSAHNYGSKESGADVMDSSKGGLLNFEDNGGKIWRFRYSFWNSSQSYVLTKGWRRFVKEKNLKAGDIVSFHRSTGSDKRLFIEWEQRDSSRKPSMKQVESGQMVRLFGVNLFSKS
ncbi:unnamed protein product, partial [Vitis vinifera]